MQGRIADLNVSVFNQKQRLTLEIDEDFRLQYDELHDKELEITVKPYRKKRSLDANAYAWELMSRIANVMRTSKDEVYFEMLKRYGQGGLLKIRKADEELILRAFAYYEKHETLYNGDEAYYRLFVGSSNYNTEEMSILIDGIVSEAKEFGIETRTPDEIAELMSLWENAK